MPQHPSRQIGRLLLASWLTLALSALVMATAAAWLAGSVRSSGGVGGGLLEGWALLMSAAGALGYSTYRLKRWNETSERGSGTGEDARALPASSPNLSSVSGLVAWLRVRPHDESDVVGVLRDLGGLLKSERVAMTWECREEPLMHVAWLEAGKPHLRTEPPGALGTIVEPALADADFSCDDLRAIPRRLLDRFAPAAVDWAGPVLDPPVTSRFDADSVASWRLNGNAIDGRLFVFDRPGIGPDDLRVGAVVADLLTAVLDGLYLLDQARERAVFDERVRLARELHDGVVQSLTGIALQLRVVGQYLLDDRGLAERRLKEIEGLVSAEQRLLRSFVKMLRVPQAGGVEHTIQDLRERLDLAAARASMQWGLSVTVMVNGASPVLSSSTAQDVDRLVTEALVNVGRHAGGSSAHVEVTCFDQHIVVAVADNGRGFPFAGRYGHDDLRALNVGPLSLRQRAASLGGSLTIESSHRGARLEFMLPLVAKTA